jgi:asparagine synthase (glutamine-hydrolysing)
MPGIFGCINRNAGPVSQELAIDIAKCLKHEDWYVDEWILDKCLLGTVELSFLHHKYNLIHDDEHSLIAVSNGNIYNKKELSEAFSIEVRSAYLNDTSFLVDLYKKKGEDFVKYLNGLFVLAIYDKEADRLLIANDRYGFYPLFYSQTEGIFGFASEAKAVTRASGSPAILNKAAVGEFFTFSFLLGDKTFFKDVKKMPPASILIYDRRTDSTSMRQYWEFNTKQKKIEASNDCLTEFCRIMRRAVARQVQDRKQVGVFLSSGLDSRFVAAFAQETGVPIITYTFGSKNCLAQKIAAEVAERLGVENVFFEIPSDFIARYAADIVYRGDGIIRIRDCHFISFLDEIRKRTSTVLLGVFGGDLCCPLSFSNRLLSLKKREEVVEYLMRRYTTVLPLEEHRKAFTDLFWDETKNSVESEFWETFNKTPQLTSTADIADYWEYHNREPRYIFQLFQHVNWYIETRNPFLDNDVVDFLAFRLPVELKFREIFRFKMDEVFFQKAMNHCFPSLADIRTSHGNVPPDSSLPKFLAGEASLFIRKRIGKVLQRLFHGKDILPSADFRTYDKWIRTGSRQYVQDVLSDSRTLNRGVFRPEYIGKILEEHMVGSKNHEQLVCDLVNFELMNRIFFESVPERNAVKG